MDKKISPMLAKTFKDGETRLPKSIYMQPKLDGLRAIIMPDGSIISRTGLRFDVAHLSEIVRNSGITIPIDGELYIHGHSLQRVNSAVTTKRSPLHRKLQFYIFDVPIIKMPFSVRLQCVREVVAELDSPFFQEVLTIATPVNQWKRYHEAFVANGFEGSILRTDGNGYEPGARSYSLWKYKDFTDIDATIIGWEEEKSAEGEKKGTLGAFRCRLDNGVEFTVRPKGMFGTRRALQAAWNRRQKYIGRRVIVKYQRFTDEGKPFSPNITTIRED